MDTRITRSKSAEAERGREQSLALGLSNDSVLGKRRSMCDVVQKKEDSPIEGDSGALHSVSPLMQRTVASIEESLQLDATSSIDELEESGYIDGSGGESAEDSIPCDSANEASAREDGWSEFLDLENVLGHSSFLYERSEDELGCGEGVYATGEVDMNSEGELYSLRKRIKRGDLVSMSDDENRLNTSEFGEGIGGISVLDSSLGSEAGTCPCDICQMTAIKHESQ